MSSKASTGRRQQAARRSCTHTGAVWRQQWQHLGASDRRVGKCQICGLDVQQLAPCPAQLHTGACLDVMGPAMTAAPSRIVQGAPWELVTARPWWARALTWLGRLLGRRGAA